jgi:predicted Zn-dependent protease
MLLVKLVRKECYQVVTKKYFTPKKSFKDSAIIDAQQGFSDGVKPCDSRMYVLLVVALVLRRWVMTGSRMGAVLASVSICFGFTLPVSAFSNAPEFDVLAMTSTNDLPLLGDADSEDLTPTAERKLGEMVMRNYRGSGAVYDDREVSEFLNRFGNKIVAAGVGQGSDFEFFLVKDNTLNAFALPGAYIGVHTGLIFAAQNESELASVLAHEAGHVTQRHIARMFGKQRRGNLFSMASLALAILAARSNPQASAGIVAAGSGLAASQQLSFSRDAEREADRVGYQTLMAAGFDTSAMVSFFTRLQKNTRLYENNAPAYLKTHPLTTERIADIQNRVSNSQVQKHTDSTEYQLVRAKMRAIADDSTEGLKSALMFFDAPNERLGALPLAARRYGQAVAWMMLNDFDQAKASLADSEETFTQPQPMLERLAIEIRLNQALRGYLGKDKNKKRVPVVDTSVISKIADDALLLRKKHVGQLSTTVLVLECLQRAGRYSEVESIVKDELQVYRSDPELYERLAESQDALGKVAEHHFSLSQSYELQGAYSAAIEQIQIAKRSGKRDDFYFQSQVDVRLKALQAKAAEEKQQQR